MTRIADDTNEIGARLRQLQAARQIPKSICAKCEGGGWVEVYSQKPPALEVCSSCGNPEGCPSP